MLKVLSVILCIALCCCITLVSLASMLENSMDGYEWAETVHIVAPGETLWDMAQNYCPEDVDCRDWIDRVSAINGIDGYIYPGDELVVLVVK